ncbi:glutaredoxin 3 [Dokdonella sp.]|uniref:glutaredoxin 3 n=1 Tax=Dokdonella sp. TaxID=2291710 RepID=UPI0035299E36
MVSVELYSSATCGYCLAAKNLLKQKGFDYEEIRIDLDPARRDEMLSRTGGRRSVPQIFVNGHHVGGFEELVAAERSGKLAEFAATGRT